MNISHILHPFQTSSSCKIMVSLLIPTQINGSIYLCRGKRCQDSAEVLFIADFTSYTNNQSYLCNLLINGIYVDNMFTWRSKTLYSVIDFWLMVFISCRILTVKIKNFHTVLYSVSYTN